MNKFIAVLSIFVLLILSACGNEGANVAEGSKTSSNKEPGYVQGVTDDEILVGITGPQTGPVAEYDKVRKGIQAHFDYVNENGGVKDRKLKLIAYDDQYQPAKTVQGIQRLVEEEKVFGIIFPIGTANFSAAEEVVRSSGVPVVGLGTGGGDFVDPPIPNVFGMQYNYANEAKVMIDYMEKELGAKNIAIAYQNDDFGLESLEGAKKAIEDSGSLKLVKEVSFLASDQDFSTQAQQLVQAKPDAILMLSTPVPAASLRQEMYKLKATDIPFFVTITGGQDKNQFNLAGKEAWEGVITAMPMKGYEYSDAEGIEEYKKFISEELSEKDLGGLTQSAWGTSQLFVEALNRVEGDLTWDKFIEALETFDNWDGSLYEAITYSPDNRYGNTTLQMLEAKGGELLPLGNPIYYNPESEEIIYE